MFVSLVGYQNRREIVEYEGKLYFEVAKHEHCTICQRRIDHVCEVIARKRLKVTYAQLLHRFPYDTDLLWVGLDKPKGEMSSEEIKDLFRETLGLPIV